MMQKMRRYEIIRLHRILIERACSAYTQAIRDGHTDPLLAIAMFILDFICIHPFNDGNGRIARVMMNAELVRADQARIIVPTVFREDYILALRKLTRHKDPLAYISVMTKLHQFSDNLYGTDFTELKNYLAACNAYEEPSQAKLQIIDRTIH